MTAVGPQLRTIRTTCACCGVGCGVANDARRHERRGDIGRSTIPRISAGSVRRAPHSARHWGWRAGCSGSDDPLRQGHRQADRLERRARPCRQPLHAHHPARWSRCGHAFYLSGQLLTEDYYVANKLMKGFIGSANVVPIRGYACPPPSPAIAAPSRRYGAGVAMRTSTRPICWCWSAPTRPGAIGAVPAHARQQAVARRASW